jgi:hypothetical protein
LSHALANSLPATEILLQKKLADYRAGASCPRKI